MLKTKSDDSEWFFFTTLDLMKNSTTKYNRKTKDGKGCWKKTGKDREIKTKETNSVIGIKKILVFCGNHHGKTNWIIHEYHATFPIDNETNLVLCRLMKKDEQLTHSSSHVVAADIDKHSTVDSTQNNNAVQILETMPIGYRFRPTDEELVCYYLQHKLVGNDSMVSNITEVNLNTIEPWDLPAFSKIKSADSEWFFFTSCDLKYNNSTRRNRRTKAGYWKSTGKGCNIKIKGTNNEIGKKRILVFYTSDHENTDWVYHEYEALNIPGNKRNFVLCRLIKKRDALMYNEGESSHVAAGTDLENIPMNFTPNVCDSPEVNIEYSNLLASPQEDEYSFLSSLQQPTATDQTPYIQSFTSSDAYFETENSNARFPYETDQDDNANYNSYLADCDVYLSEETSQNSLAFGDGPF